MVFYPVGTLVANRYEVVKTLTGGMGVVYLCLDRRKDMPVALKTFRPEYLSNRTARDRFLREGTTWVEMGHHPHVVRAHRVERTSHGLEVYLVLEWVAQAEGKRDASLRAWLSPGRLLPLEQTLLFALHIVRGMQHATSVIPGLVHRDLKPENILVGRDGNVRVTDFGLAKALTGLDSGMLEMGKESSGASLEPISLSRTRLTHAVVGTPLYMAPEQWAQGEELDARTDIYAFGCIVYEMVMGKPAAGGQDVRELERAHRTGQIGEMPRDLPHDVQELVQRCLAASPEDRYMDWMQVASATTEAYRCVAGQEPPVEVIGREATRAERVAMGWSYHAMGASYLDINKYNVAASYFERVLAIGRQEQDRPLEAAGLGNLGLCYRALGEPHRAIECHELQLAISRGIGERREEGAGLCNLGNAYVVLGDFQRAITYHEQDLAVAREIGDRHGEGRALNNLGTAYSALGKPRQAIELFEQALIINRETGDRREEGTALMNLGDAYQTLGEIQRAIQLFEQSRSIAAEVGNRRGESAALGNLAVAYKNIGDLPKAMEFYEASLAASRETGYQEGEMAGLTGLGLISARLGEAQQAIEYHAEALVIARGIRSRQGEATALGNLANAYDQLGDKRQAMAYHQQRLTLVRQIGDRRGEGQTLGNMAVLYAESGDKARALELYTQALAIKEEVGDLIGASNTKLNLAGLRAGQGRLREALTYAEEAAQGYAQAGWSDRAHYAQQVAAKIRSYLG
jgi:tetratricopeptide (TPR) repeat protein